MQPLLKRAILTERFFLLTAIVAFVTLQACSQEPASHAVQVVSVCEVLRNIDIYEGKLIRVRGVYFDGIRDQCPTAIREWGGTVWPSALNIADSNLADLLKRPVDFHTDRVSWDALQEFWMMEARKGIREEIWVTFDGTLQTAEPASRRLGGFGHLGSFPAQFVVKSVDVKSISVLAKPTYEYRIDGRRHL